MSEKISLEDFPVIKKKWKLESFLQETVSNFEEPKLTLEQYITPPELASSILWDAHMRGDITDNKRIIDLGCGTGMLSSGCAALSISNSYDNYILGVDIDSDSLGLIDTLEGTINLLHCDVLSLPILLTAKKTFDVVFLNPPFGTKRNKGIDIEFLKIACNECADPVNGVIYSLHKTSTRSYILKKIKNWGWNAEVVGMKYDLPNTYDMHKKKNVVIKVDLFRISKKPPRKQDFDDMSSGGGRMKKGRRGRGRGGKNKRRRGGGGGGRRKGRY